MAFWGGAVPGNESSLMPPHEAGVVGFKCFLLDSGVPGFPPLEVADLRPVLGSLAGVDALLIAHAARLHHRHPVTPYAGRTLTGRVRQTWLHGSPLLEGKGEAAVGRPLKRG